MSGQLSREDIITEGKNADGLKIVPFNLEQLKGASYDISPAIIAMSTKIGMLETVYKDKNYPYRYYIYVKAKDTVLAVSQEFISVPLTIAGNVVSRVSKVSEGFGHVSTSIDPNWKGALLIALGNPSNKPIKIYVGGNSIENTGNNSLATVSFYYLNSPCNTSTCVYSGMRLDLLQKLKYSQRHGIKAWFKKIIHPRRRKFTDFFFHYCENATLSESNWSIIVKELQGITSKANCKCCKNCTSSSKKEKQHLGDFIETENAFLRFFHFMQKNWPTIWKIIVIAFALLVAFNAIPEDSQAAIKNFFGFYNMF